MNESTQSFKEWGREIDAKLEAAGLTKTGETGAVYFLAPQPSRWSRITIAAAALIGGVAIGALGTMLWDAEFI